MARPTVLSWVFLVQLLLLIYWFHLCHSFVLARFIDQLRYERLPVKASRYLRALRVIHLEPQNRRTKNRRRSKWTTFYYSIQNLLLFEIPCSIFDILNTKEVRDQGSAVNRKTPLLDPMLYALRSMPGAFHLKTPRLTKSSSHYLAEAQMTRFPIA